MIWWRYIGFSILYDMLHPDEGEVISKEGIWILENFTREEIKQHTEPEGYINIEALESLYKQKHDDNI
jgi:hypothetical protein